MPESRQASNITDTAGKHKPASITIPLSSRNSTSFFSTMSGAFASLVRLEHGEKKGTDVPWLSQNKANADNKAHRMMAEKLLWFHLVPISHPIQPKERFKMLLRILLQRSLHSALQFSQSGGRISDCLFLVPETLPPFWWGWVVCGCLVGSRANTTIDWTGGKVGKL